MSSVTLFLCPRKYEKEGRTTMSKYTKFIFGLIQYLNGRLTPEEAIVLAEGVLRERVEKRDENFLNLVKRGIYGYRESPYLKLLKQKIIDYADIKKWVEQEGLEKALLNLQVEGVYFTVEEYKGRCEVHRKGIRFLLNEKEFHNPFVSAAYEVRSGATRSAGTRIRIDFDYLIQMSFYDAFILSLHDALTSPIANWFPIFPGAPGINSSLRFARIGNPPRKWFTQVEKSHLKVNWEKRLGTNYIMYMGRLLGVPMAKPELVDLNNAYEVAKWASTMLDNHPNCVVYTFASSAVRVCIAARVHGLNIRGTRFLVTGEPLTPQKKKEIETTGALAVPIYGISEAGVVAAGCNQADSKSDHCHYYKDTIAIVNSRRRVPMCDDEVNALQFTSLLKESPKILLNVEMGDYGTIEKRSCPCRFDKLGFDMHIHGIGSYEKLTGEGVTFVNTDFVKIMEEILPGKFGGESTDYQLIEEEGATGLTSLNLVISPRVGAVDEKEVVNMFIKQLRNATDSDENWTQSGPLMWEQAGTIRVRREYPVPTKRAKILPFHIVKA
jgi:hypothetical protein